MPTPKSISVTLEEIKYDLEDTIPNVVSYLQKKQTHYTREGYTEIKLDIGERSDYGDNDYAYVELVGSRMETEQEAEYREAQERAQQAYRDKRDRDAYEALKKKFDV